VPQARSGAAAEALTVCYAALPDAGPQSLGDVVSVPNSERLHISCLRWVWPLAYLPLAANR
jgi:hypothetical protein